MTIVPKTAVYMSDMPLTWRHIRIEAIASLGQLIGTALATIVGVIIPMINIMRHDSLDSAIQGILGSTSLIGIAVGAFVFGRLIDRFGYLLFFRLCPLIVAIFATAAVFLTSIPALTVCLFFIGLGIGGEYSLDSGYISELMPDRYRFLMVGIAKAASALGNIIAAALCFWLVDYWNQAEMWPRLMWIISITGCIMFLLRINFAQSPQWLLEKGSYKEAVAAARKLLGPDVNVNLQKPQPTTTRVQDNKSSGFFDFLKKNTKQVVFSGIPWACEGLGVYGIGIFLPILIMSLGIESAGTAEAPIAHVASSVETTLYISCIILPGFLLGLLLINRVYNVKLEFIGFMGSAGSLIILMLAYHFHWDKWISITAFMAFELFLNLGPHLMTYVLPPKIYPVEDRGQGTGIAASMGKIGAVVAVFFIPLLLKWGGVILVLATSAAVMIIGGLITIIYGRIVLPSRKRNHSDSNYFQSESE